MANVTYGKAVIWGVGLMGGSLALALKKKKVARQVWGLGRNSSRLSKAKRRLKLSGIGTDPAGVCAGADLIILAGPFERYKMQLSALNALDLKPKLVTEVGSLKGPYVTEWTRAASSLPFAASHPMCGSEKSGFENAQPDLFAGATAVLTPVPHSSKPALQRAAALWRALGMRVVSMRPPEHDRRIGALSHLTHAAAVALTLAVDTRLSDKDYELAGTGYWDATRIAAADSELWTSILDNNADELDLGLAALQDQAAKLRRLIRDESPEGLKRWLDRAARLRRKAESKRRGR